MVDTKDKEMMPISMPIIRKTCPALLAETIFSIAPNVGKDIAVDYIREPKEHHFGDMIHDFIDGYMVHDGIGFITICEFVKVYGKESIKLFNETFEGSKE